MEAHISVLVYSPDQSAKMPPDRNKVKMHDDGCKLYHEEERQRVPQKDHMCKFSYGRNVSYCSIVSSMFSFQICNFPV
ncbi:hypothetical protein DAI22_12g168000 [Oryza sativa Japonica Group]|nr:hypothetical protein DAI22_12g168000 [Oryza sativa Japonica Group]